MQHFRRPIAVRRAALATAVGLIATVSGEALAQATLEEIVVTARKREESVQDIPVVVTAFTADELARRGVSELEDVAAATPGLAFEDFSNGFSAAPVIRGLTQVNVSSEVQNVATFVDGIYLQRNFSVDIGQADLERIEVVKGPQSALYGRNAFNGAMLPKVVDQTTYTALMSLRPDQLDGLLGDLLTPEEVDAAKSRLTDIQTELGKLQQGGQVLQNVDDWALPSTSQHLGVPDMQTMLTDLRNTGKPFHKGEPVVQQYLGNASDSSYVAREATMLQMCLTQPYKPFILPQLVK